MTVNIRKKEYNKKNIKKTRKNKINKLTKNKKKTVTDRA